MEGTTFVYLFETQSRADYEMREYLRRDSDAFTFNKIGHYLENDLGNRFYFLSKQIYPIWCKGRSYVLCDENYRSGARYNG